MEVLYCDSFLHEAAADHVDEVLFKKPVIVSACHIVPKDGNPEPELLEFFSLTSPPPFNLQVFYHNGDQNASHFQKLGPQISWVADGGKESIDPQPVVTRHLVFRGNYQNLSLIIYGATIPDEADATGAKAANAANPLLIDAAPSFVAKRATSGLRALALSPPEAGRTSWLLPLLQAGEAWEQSGRPELGPRGTHWSLSSIAEAASQVEAASLGAVFGGEAEGPADVSGSGQLASAEYGDGSAAGETAWESGVQVAIRWLAEGGSMLPAGLCAGLVACSHVTTCYRFLAYGGAALLIDLLAREQMSPAVKLRVLACLSRVTSHGFGCEALLGWWLPGATSGGISGPAKTGAEAKPEPMEVDGEDGEKRRGVNGQSQGSSKLRGPSKAYGALLSVLLKPQPRRTALFAARLLKRLRLYELVSDFNQIGREILLSDEDQQFRRHAGASIRMAANLLQEIVSVVTEGDTALGDWPPPMASLSTSVDLNEVSLARAHGPETGDASDPALWALLKDRQLLGMLAALLASPVVRRAQRGTVRAAAGLVGATWALAVPMLETRAGLLFLGEQPASVRALVIALEGSASKQDRNTTLEHERAVPQRQLATMLAIGATELCSGCQLARLLGEGVRAVSLLDALLAAAKVLTAAGGQHQAGEERGGASEQSVREASLEALSAAKELSQMAASESSRQAVVAVLSLPEALPGLLQLLMHQAPEASHLPSATDESPVPEASILPHYIGLILLALLTDPSPAALAVSAPQGLHLQAAIAAQGMQPSSHTPVPESDASVYPLTSVLTSWSAPTVVWKKEGPLALLQLLALLTGLRKGPAAELGFNLQGYHLAHAPDDTDLGLAAKDELERALLASPAAAANATVALRLLAALAVHPAVSATLYDAGGVEVLLQVFAQAAQALDDLPTYFDVPADHVEAGAIAELAEAQQERRILLLLLPALSLTTLLLTKLQSSGVQYRNTPLVTALLTLNSALSSRPAYTADVLKVSPSGNTLLLHAVRQGLASVVAFWAVDARWGPALLPKLLAALPQEAGTVAGEAPRAVLGLLQLLADILPEEYPPAPAHAHSLRALHDGLPVIAAGSVLGPASAGLHTWSHKQGEKLAKALALHVEALGASMGRLALTSCQPLQEALARLSSRVCALGADHSQALTRHLYAPLQSAISDFLADAPGPDEASPPERDARGWRLVRALNLLGYLVQSPAVKAGLQALPVAAQMTSLLRSAGVPAALGARLGIGSLGVLQNLVNPAVCLTPQAPEGQRMVEAAPPHEQSQAVAAALLETVSTLHVKDGRMAAALRVLGLLAGNDRGRNAIATVAWKGGDATSDVEPMDEGVGSKGAFTLLWEALAAALTSSVKASGGSELGKLLGSAAGVGLALADGGKSEHGRRALRRLFEGANFVGGPVQQVVTLLGEVVHTIQGPSAKSVKKDFSLSSSLADVLTSVGAEAAPSPEAALAELTAQAAAFDAPRDLTEQFEEAAAARAAKAKLEEGPNRVALRPGASPRDNVNGDGEWTRSLEGWVSFKEEGSIRIEQRPQDQAWSERVPWQYSTDIVWPPAPKPSLKRKAEGDANEAQAKKQTAAQTAAQAAAATLAARKDPFRARRQNTGRPPSMHVDDFMAQKGGAVAVPAQATAARIHTGGRAPSIRVDDFMKLESEKGRTVVGAPLQPAAEPGAVPLVTSAGAKPVVVRAPTAAVVRLAGQAAVVKPRVDPAKVVVSQAAPTGAKPEARAVPMRPPGAHLQAPARPVQPPPPQQPARAPLPPMVRPPIQSAYIPLPSPTPPSPAPKPVPAAWPKPLHEVAQTADRASADKPQPFKSPQPVPAPPQSQASFADPRRQPPMAASPAETSLRGPAPPSADPRRATAPQQQSFDPRRSAAPQPEAGPSADPRRAAMQAGAPTQAQRPEAPSQPPAHDSRRAASGVPALPTADPRRRADPRLMGRSDSFGAASPPVPVAPGWQKQPSPGGGVQAQRGPQQAYGQSMPSQQQPSPGISQAQAWPTQQQPRYGGQGAAPVGVQSQQMQPAAAQGGAPQGAQAGPSAPRPVQAKTTEMMGKLQEILKQPGFIQGLLKDRAKMATFLAANPAIVPMLKNMLAQMGKKSM